jgi:hypothetical protein
VSKWKEHRYGDYLLRVVKDRDYYDILLIEMLPKPGHLSTGKGVRLMGRFLNTNLFMIDDIQGNGYYSGLQGKGIGTLLVNVMITILKEAGCDETEVSGDLTQVGDPDEPNLAAKCKEGRERFWQSFGFGITPISRCDQIRAKVKDLQVVRKPDVFCVVPNCPGLSDLHEVSSDDYCGDLYRFPI